MSRDTLRERVMAVLREVNALRDSALSIPGMVISHSNELRGKN